MARDDGMARLLEAAEEAKPPIEIVGSPDPTPADVAVQMWLKDQELLEPKHAEQFLRNPRTFESLGTGGSPVPTYRDPMSLADTIKKDLDEFFEKKKRGRNTNVLAYARKDSVWFLGRHGDPFERGRAIRDKGESVGVDCWPKKLDVLVLDPAEGEVRINTRNRGEKTESREVFGRHW